MISVSHLCPICGYQKLACNLADDALHVLCGNCLTHWYLSNALDSLFEKSLCNLVDCAIDLTPAIDDGEEDF